MTRSQRIVLVLGAGLNALVLVGAGVGAGRQLLTWAVFFLMALTGKALLGKAGKQIADPVARAAIGLLLGLAGFSLISFILLHLGPLPAILGGLAFLGAGAVGGLSRPQHEVFPSRLLGTGTLAVSAILAAAVAAGSFCGFYRSPQAPDRHTRLEAALAEDGNWGWNADKRWWLIEHGNELEYEGLPGTSHLHEGVPVFYLSLARLTGGGGPEGRAEVYKASGGILIFTLLVLLAWAARQVFGGGPAAGVIAAVSLPFFAPITYQYLAGNHPWYLAFFNIWGGSSYLGFFPAGAGLHHNVTFLFGLLLGGGGGICILRALQGKRELLLPGVFLVAASLFFKPSFFSVAVPALGLVLLFERSLPGRSKLVAAALVAGAAGAWFLYPWVFGIPTLEAKAVWKPFAVVITHASRHFPPESGSSRVAIWASLLSFAVLIPVGLEGAIRAKRSIRRRGAAVWISAHKAELTVGLVFLSGIGSYALLAQEGGMFRHANLSWGAAMAYVMILPLLAVRICRLRPALLAGGVWALYLLHLWGGIYHLYRLIGLGRIH